MSPQPEALCRIHEPDPAELGQAVAEYWADHLANARWAGRCQLRGVGPVAEFEAKITEIVGKKHCLAVNNATNGLLVLAIATGLVGAEVITTPQSYGATWGPLRLLKNRLRFGRVDDDGNLSPGSVEKLVSRQTRAVLAVDCEGRPHDSAGVRDVCRSHGLVYLADAARSFGRRLRAEEKHASSYADALVLSFGPGKPLFCGEGGAILTDDEAIYRECIRISQHPERFRYEFSLSGWTDIQPLNARMHPIAALIGLAQLQRLTRSQREQVRQI